MSMFSSYENLPSNYIPNNSSPKEEKQTLRVEKTLPRVAKNVYGTPIGLSWNYGDRFDLKLSLKQKIKVNKDSIIYNKTGETPSTSTCGVAGKQAYNTRDCKSWTCVGFNDGLFLWIEDDNIIYSSDGTKEIELNPDFSNKNLICEIYNFRWELIANYSATGANDISIPVDDDIDKILKPGVYYCLLRSKEGEKENTLTRVFRKLMLIVE